MFKDACAPQSLCAYPTPLRTCHLWTYGGILSVQNSDFWGVHGSSTFFIEERWENVCVWSTMHVLELLGHSQGPWSREPQALCAIQCYIALFSRFVHLVLQSHIWKEVFIALGRWTVIQSMIAGSFSPINLCAQMQAFFKRFSPLLFPVLFTPLNFFPSNLVCSSFSPSLFF